MPKIISFFSPKTAGASSVSLNAAILQQLVNSNLKVAFVEVSGWNSQAVNIQPNSRHTWAKLTPFYKTPEWNSELLARLKFNLGADIFWSPERAQMPTFNRTFANAWRTLLKNNYDLIVVDICAAAPSAWQHFWLGESSVVVAVLTPDPMSENAFLNWCQTQDDKEKIKLLINQVPRSEHRRVTQKFKALKANFMGVVSPESEKFWRQCYQAQVVALQRRSRFKKELYELLPLIFNQ